MKKFAHLPVLLALMISAVFVSEAQIKLPQATNIPTYDRAKDIVWPEALITVPEKTAYLNTSSYAEVMQVVNYAAANSPLLHIRFIGESDSGQPIPLLILSKDGITEPEKANLPAIYLQANIHGGEVEGKEAVQILVRDILFGHKKHLLDNQIVLITPVYNIDGNDNFGENTRPSQEGSPIQAGTRANGAGLDLNRDGVKVEGKETQALLAEIIAKWDPLVLVDLHTTNGTWHGYSLTWAPSYHTVGDYELYDFTWSQMLPDITETVWNQYNVMMGPFGDYYGLRRWPVETFSTYNHHPRYLVNMMGVRNRIGILSEGFAHERFYQRIHAAHAFITEILEYTNKNAFSIQKIAEEADLYAVEVYRDRAGKEEKGVRFEMVPMEEKLTLRTYDYGTYIKTNGDTVIFRKPNMVHMEEVAYRAKFNPTTQAKIPRGYILPAEMTEVVAHLEKHGIEVKRLDSKESFKGEAFQVEKVNKAQRKFEGHNMVTLEGTWKNADKDYTAGAFMVDAAQPLGHLIFYLLEPQSDDGLTAWNFLDNWLEEGKEYPVFKYFELP
jgi:hypothetical protein